VVAVLDFMVKDQMVQILVAEAVVDHLVMEKLGALMVAVVVAVILFLVLLMVAEMAALAQFVLLAQVANANSQALA